LILYTIYPPEAVMAEENVDDGGFFEIEVEGKRVLLSPDGPGQGRIVRMISTDPEDYLDPRFSPGNMIFWLNPY
jgi:hypothetical protein